MSKQIGQWWDLLLFPCIFLMQEQECYTLAVGCSACILVCKQFSEGPYKTLKVVCKVHLTIVLKMTIDVQRRKMSAWCLGLLVMKRLFFSLTIFFLYLFLSYFSYCRTATSSDIVSSSPQMVWHSFTCLFVIKTTQTHCSNQ